MADGERKTGEVLIDETRVLRNPSAGPGKVEEDLSDGARHCRKIQTDTNDRKEYGSVPPDSESNYRAIFENAIMGIYQSSPEGRYLKVNHAFARIFGFDSPEEVIRSVTDIGKQMYANPEDRSRIIALLNGRECATVETSIRRKDGTIGWILNNVRIVRDQDGKIRYYEGFVQDIADLKQVEEELQRTLRELESRVRERTADLEETNTALRILVNRRTDDQKHLEERLQLNVNDLILPIIEELKAGGMDKKGMAYLAILESNLKDIASPYLYTLHSAHRNLTPREIRIAEMIRGGMKTKQISELMGISPVTVETHRNHIRRKLGLVKAKANLRSYLLSIV